MDGCRNGWAAVVTDTSGRRALDTFARFEDVLALEPAVVMIDIPIGLPQSGDRGCDLMARAALGRHWPRVFTGARRPLIEHRTDYAAANRWAKADGAGLSRQLFGILPKIADVDSTMTAARQGTVRECHPELVFQRINGGAPLASKKTDAGRRERIALVKKAGFAEIDEWLGSLRGLRVGADDLLDACACAIAAQETAEGGGHRFSCGKSDAKGLRMEIWF